MRLSVLKSRFQRYIKKKCFYYNTSVVAMVKRKASTGQGSVAVPQAHSLTTTEVSCLRQDLLSWYDAYQRELPWRTIAKEEKNVNKRLYSVWVSEIMLQQTQVATVIDYYNKWTKKWPTVEELAKATLEEVNEMWSGLGYYSRGRRLHEGAQKVMNDLDGEIPRSAEALLKHLPGVGRYTAGAIASIALGEATGVVDGNVSRVFSRLCVIGADITSQTINDTIWVLANNSVDPDRPGDYNQAMMELGATVCTPKTPKCGDCPVRGICKAYKQSEKQKIKNAAKLLKPSNGASETSEVVDIECVAEDCQLCLPLEEPWDPSAGVLNYPRKGKKKAPREQRAGVCVLHRQSHQGNHDREYLLVQRPDTGLLAGLWEFPSILIDLDSSDTQSQLAINEYIQKNFAVNAGNLKRRQHVGDVIHIFSHIHQTYTIETASVPEENVDVTRCPMATKWATSTEINSTAISTAMKKVFKAVENFEKKGAIPKQVSKGKVKTASDGKKQLGLTSFFKKTS